MIEILRTNVNESDYEFGKGSIILLTDSEDEKTIDEVCVENDFFFLSKRYSNNTNL